MASITAKWSIETINIEKINRTLEDVTSSISFYSKDLDELKNKFDSSETKARSTPEENTHTRNTEEANRYPRNTEEAPRFNDETDLLICFDSNRRFIDYRKLWTIKGSKRWNCGSLRVVKDSIEKDTSIKSLKHILINVGVNDIDSKSGEEVFDEIRETIEVIRKKHKDIKIILSEITPRNDSKDSEVKKCNNLVEEWIKSETNIYIAKHSNLRDSEWSMFADIKHIHQSAAPKFAANIKRALRAAYNIPPFQRKFQSRYRQSGMNDRNERNEYYEFVKWKNQFSKWKYP